MNDLKFMGRMLGVDGADGLTEAQLRAEVARRLGDPIAVARASGRIDALLQQLPIERQA